MIQRDKLIKKRESNSLFFIYFFLFFEQNIQLHLFVHFFFGLVIEKVNRYQQSVLMEV